MVTVKNLYPLPLISDIDDFVNVVKTLIKERADISLSDKNGYAPLHLAAQKGNEAVARLLIDRPNMAVEEGNEAAARLLIGRGAEVTAADWHNWTPRYIVAQEGHETNFRLLNDSGADVSAADCQKYTPLHHTAQ
ncbi:ankyrin repeat-containing domain protein [Sphaerosporella brunnea]|uniref:Ankyrin repeat-containing domain protein n=1 Tax=Sphaerosporella brunnea TaxID=1250544 RepID=A0A5J5EFT9_9PEZI|nr:ankyrin repeat-containing domain protein [Sphaerosporella brunnea]